MNKRSILVGLALGFGLGCIILRWALSDTRTFSPAPSLDGASPNDTYRDLYEQATLRTEIGERAPAVPRVVFRIATEGGEPIQGARLGVVESIARRIDLRAIDLAMDLGGSSRTMALHDVKGKFMVAWHDRYLPTYAKAPSEAGSYDIVLTASEPMQMKVRDTFGVPISGISVALSRTALDAESMVSGQSPNLSLPGPLLSSAIYSAVTDDDGRAIMKHVPGGRYDIELTHTSYALVSGIAAAQVCVPGNYAEVVMVPMYAASVMAEDKELLGLTFERGEDWETELDAYPAALSRSIWVERAIRARHNSPHVVATPHSGSGDVRSNWVFHGLFRHHGWQELQVDPALAGTVLRGTPAFFACDQSRRVATGMLRVAVSGPDSRPIEGIATKVRAQHPTNKAIMVEFDVPAHESVRLPEGIYEVKHPTSRQFVRAEIRSGGETHVDFHVDATYAGVKLSVVLDGAAPSYAVMEIERRGEIFRTLRRQDPTLVESWLPLGDYVAIVHVAGCDPLRVGFSVPADKVVTCQLSSRGRPWK